MDFTETDDQLALVEMAESVLNRLEPAEWSRLFGFDENLWEVLSDNGFLTAALPEVLGGDGVGLGAIASVSTLLGQRAAVTPFVATVAGGVLPLLAYGAAETFESDLRAVGDGAIMTAAVAEIGHALPERPETTAQRSGDRVVVHGRKVAVPYAAEASLMLVTTSAGVVALSPRTPGMTVLPTLSSSGAPEATVVFDEVDVPASALIGSSCRVINDHLRCAYASFADGLAEGALRLTADHLASRSQFGRPLATFQAVSQQIADAYVVARTVHLVAVAATWRMEQGLDASADTALAAFWVSAELPQMMQQCHHLHGGTGADVTYPMHRYYSTAKDLARFLGGASHTLELLGAQCTSI
ncbi:MAG: acyl-CoA dehydrogenase family protein [Rhodococcus sp. (in: high G+C Gram-positive bacteria)]